MFFLLLIWKRSLCIYVESFFSSKRSDRKSLFSMDALKQLYQPVENHTLSKKSIWMYKKEKKIIQLDALLMLLCFFAICKWALSFLFVLFFFFGKNLRQVFSVCFFFSLDYIWVLPHAFIESYVKWIKKNILQFLKSILLTWVIIS